MYCPNCERETQPTFICPVHNSPSVQAGCAWRTDGNPACVEHWEYAPCNTQDTTGNVCEHCGQEL